MGRDAFRFGASRAGPRNGPRARGARCGAPRLGALGAAWLAGLLAAGGLLEPALARAAGPLTEPQLAYLDPGAGSLLLQAIVAAIAGASLAIAAYWRRIRAFFGRGSRAPKRSDRAPRDD